MRGYYAGLNFLQLFQSFKMSSAKNEPNCAQAGFLGIFTDQGHLYLLINSLE